jgi:hypothetical protein
MASSLSIGTPSVLDRRSSHAERVLPLLVAMLAAFACAMGLFARGLYRDTSVIRDAWIVNDAVTVLTAVPLVAVMTRRATTGSMHARILLIGALHYVLYNYTFYLFGASLNALFPLYIGIVALAGWALIVVIRGLDPQRAAVSLRGAPARRVAAWMMFVALGLTTTWIAHWLVAIHRTTPPARFDLTPEFVRVVAGIDLTMMVAVLSPGAVALWRRRPWGFVAGAAVNMSAALYNLVLAGGTVVQIRAGMAGGWPMLALWFGLSAGCALGASTLLRRQPQARNEVNSTRRSTSPARASPLVPPPPMQAAPP